MYRELEDRLAHIPGVKRAALALYTPLQDNWGEIPIREGQGMPNMSGGRRALVGPCHRRLSGNVGPAGSFAAAALRNRTPLPPRNVAVVDETFVKKFFKPGEDPIGTRFGLDLPKYGSTYEIVGVVRNAKYSDAANTPGRSTPDIFCSARTAREL